MKKTGLENSDTLPKKEDIEKAKITGESPLKQDPDETPIITTLQKPSDKEDMEESHKKFEFAKKQVQEDSTGLMTDKGFELDVTNALEKADVNSDL